MTPIVADVVTKLQSTGSATIDLPMVGLTLKPPWGYAICRKNKRVENRAPSVAGRVREWHGLVALTHSSTWARGQCNVTVRNLVEDELFDRDDVAACDAWTKERAGKVFVVAELVDVHFNGDDPTDPWAVPGEHGLILGHVIEVTPVPCIGGLGVFRFGACMHCGKPHAHERDKAIQCRSCELKTPFEQITQPLLTVRAVRDPSGKLVAEVAS